MKMDLIWIDSTTISLAPLRGSGVLKNKTLHWAGKKGLKHSRSMWASVKRILCGTCLSASNKLDMTVFNELMRKYPLSPDARRQGAFCPGMSDRERYKTRHTVERFFAHIKEHKRLIARFDKLDTTFFSFFALACLKVFI